MLFKVVQLHRYSTHPLVAPYRGRNGVLMFSNMMMILRKELRPMVQLARNSVLMTSDKQTKFDSKILPRHSLRLQLHLNIIPNHSTLITGEIQPVFNGWSPKKCGKISLVFDTPLKKSLISIPRWQKLSFREVSGDRAPECQNLGGEGPIPVS